MKNRRSFSVFTVCALLITIIIPLLGDTATSADGDTINDSIISESNEEVILDKLQKTDFVENIGQLFRDDILFYIVQENIEIGFKSSGILYHLRGDGGNGHLYEMEFIQPDKPEIVGVSCIDNSLNYIRGEDKKDQYIGIRTFEEIRYKNIWTGIDLRYYQSEGALKYDFIVQPGTDPDKIQLRCTGASPRIVNERLIISTSIFDISEDKPISFDESGGSVQTGWSIDMDRISFDVDDYDSSKVLVIDPKLTFSTFIGGSAWDFITGIDVGPNGHIYSTGYTNSVNFPTTTGAYDKTYCGNNYKDIFVVKLNKTGSNIFYSTYVGGRTEDLAFGIAVDSNGNAFVTGRSTSYDLNRFPTTSGAYNTIYTGLTDAILFKLNSAGSNLMFSTYIGGFRRDCAYDIALDPDGNPVIVGDTNIVEDVGKDQYPTTDDAYDNSHGGWSDVFVSKFNPSGSSLLYSTLIGGASEECAEALTIDENGNIYITGYTKSSGYPKTRYDKYRGGGDIFISILNYNLSTLKHSTTIGGSGSDKGKGIALNEDHYVYITGTTFSSNFPTFNGLSTYFGGGYCDCVILKFNDTLKPFTGSLLGGNWYDVGVDISINDHNEAIVTGYTWSNNFPTTNWAYDTSPNGNGDVFLTRISSDEKSIEYSTYIGGPGNEEGPSNEGWSNHHALLDNGIVYIGGATTSSTFPVTQGSYSTTHSGRDDAFVLKTYPDVIRPGTISVSKGPLYINISWDPPKERMFRHFSIINYTIYSGSSPGTLQKLAVQGNITWYNYTLNNYISNPYYFGVIANWSEIGASNITLSNAIIPIISPPISKPTIKPGYFSVNISWPPLSSDITDDFEVDYRIFRNTTGGSQILLNSTEEVNWYIDVFPTVEQVRYTYSVTYNITGVGERTPRSENVTGTALILPNITGFSLESQPFAISLTWDGYGPDITDNMDVSYQINKGIDPSESEMINEINESTYLDFLGEFEQITYMYSVLPVFNNLSIGNRTEILSSTAIILENTPRDFSVIATDIGFDLSWNPPDETIRLDYPVLGYSIYRQIDDGEIVQLEEYHKNLTYQDVALSHIDRNDYRYHICARFQILGEGNPSDVISRTNRIYPTSPRNITAKIGDGYIHIYWLKPDDDGGSPITSYGISRYNYHNLTMGYLGTLPYNMTDFNDTSVIMGMSYRYIISAENGVGKSLKAAEINTTARWIPDEPRNLTATYGDAWIYLQWEPPIRDGGASIEHYNIYRQVSNDDWVLIGSTDPGQTYYNDSSVSIGMRCNYSISVCTIIGESEKTFVYNIIPATIPDPPSGLELIIDGEYILITWNVPDYQGGLNLIEYIIIRNGEIISHVDSSLQTYSDHDVKYGETYSYSLISVNGEGYSTRSESMELLFCRPPDPPENVTISISEDSILIKWDIPGFNGGSWITNYRIHKDGSFLAEINNITLEYIDENVEPGILYEYTVISINRRGESPGVNLTIEIPIIPPIIAGITTSYDETGVLITWIKPKEGDVTDIEIYRIKDDGEPLKLTTLDVNETSFLDDSITEPGTYSYHVIGINRYGNSTSFITSELILTEDDLYMGSDGSDKPFLWIILLIIGILIIIIAGILYLSNKRKKDPVRSKEITPDDIDEEKKPDISSDFTSQDSDNARIEVEMNNGQIDSPVPIETTTIEVQQDVDIPSPQNSTNISNQSVQMESIQKQQPDVVANSIETAKQPDLDNSSNNDIEIRSPCTDL